MGLCMCPATVLPLAPLRHLDRCLRWGSCLEELLQARGVRVVYPEMLSLLDQLQIYRDAQILIVAEGSAQHGLELLGVHLEKQVILICRRPQREGMDLPLKARFPKLQVVEAVTTLWVEKDGVAWNGLAELDWDHVASALNQLLDEPFSASELRGLSQASAQQLKQLSAAVVLEKKVLKRSS